MHKPVQTEVVTTGSVISTATKTGTVPDLNQNNAVKITAITGVVRINASGSSKKSFQNSEDAHKNPKNIPAAIEIKKALITRRKVYKNAFQNPAVTARLQICLKTKKGSGKMRGAFIYFAKTSHKIKIDKMEIV